MTKTDRLPKAEDPDPNETTDVDVFRDLTPACCHPQCTEQAEYALKQHGDDPYAEFYACSTHLADVIGAGVHSVWELSL